MMTTKQKDWVLWVALLLIAAGLRLHQLDGQSLWFDEGWSAYAANLPNVWTAANHDTTNPPLYYALLYLHRQVAGDSIFALRWLSFALGMVGVALAGQLARRYGGRQALTVALVLAAINTPLIWAAREMRMYTLLAVLVTVAALALHRLSTTGRGWWALLIAELALLYSHNTAPVIVIWLNIAFGVMWLSSRRPSLWRWLLGQVAVGVLWLPYFITRFLLVADANRALVRRTPFDLRLWEGFWLAPWEAVIQHDFSMWSGTALVVVIALGLWRGGRGWWALFHAVLLLIGVWGALAVLGNELHGRYLVMMIPLLLVFVAVTLSHLPRVVMGAGIALALFVSFGGWNWLHAPAYQHDDNRAMTQHYADTLTAEDSVLMWSYADRYAFAYYWDKLNVAAQRVTLPEGADLDSVWPLLPTGGDVSLNVWYGQRADYRGMLGCVLSHGTTAPPNTLIVNGMMTQTYTAPVWVKPSFVPVDVRYRVADVVGVAVLPDDFHAGQAVCVPVTMQARQTTADELSAAWVVTDSNGRVITQTSSVLATADGRTTADALTPDETLTAYPVIRLPEGTPPDTYTLRLRLFDAANLSGYDVLRDGVPSGKDAAITTWNVQAGARWLSTLPDAVTLDAVTITPNPVRNGGRTELDLLWTLPPDVPLPRVTLGVVDVPTTVTAHDDRVREVRRVTIPDEAQGELGLLVEGLGEVLTVDVESLPMVRTLPDAIQGDAITFADGVTLHGHTRQCDGITCTVTLVWSTDAPLATDYTAFVQALDGRGALIAQSDRVPNEGNRPTTGWRMGEYITDTHTLTLPENTNAATWIAGLYDGDGVRLLTENGENVALLLAQDE